MRKTLEQLTEAELLAALIQQFGYRRAMELFGWAAVWALSGEESPSKVYAKLSDQGVSRTSAFHAARDVREFQERMKAEGYEPVTVVEFFRRLRSSTG